jgi:hypothetical protein
MAERKPIVIDNSGNFEELPEEDTLPGSGESGDPTITDDVTLKEYEWAISGGIVRLREVT